jgi:hypothetical protein
MTHFREWRSSTREYEGTPNITKRSKNIYVFIGAFLLLAFFVGLAALKYFGI